MSGARESHEFEQTVAIFKSLNNAWEIIQNIAGSPAGARQISSRACKNLIFILLRVSATRNNFLVQCSEQENDIFQVLRGGGHHRAGIPPPRGSFGRYFYRGIESRDMDLHPRPPPDSPPGRAPKPPSAR